MSSGATGSLRNVIRNRRQTAFALGLVLALTLATGCSQTADSAGGAEVSRQAAAQSPFVNDESIMAPENDELTGADELTGTLGSPRLGVFTCVSNRTTADLSVTWIWANTSEGDGSVAPGGHRCAEATSRTKELVLGVYVTLPGAKTNVKWFFGGTQAYTDATRSARCFSPLYSAPYLFLATCWSSTTAPPSRETATMPQAEGGYSFEVIKRPSDQNALGGMDASGNRWHRFEISVTS